MRPLAETVRRRSRRAAAARPLIDVVMERVSILDELFLLPRFAGAFLLPGVAVLGPLDGRQWWPERLVCKPGSRERVVGRSDLRSSAGWTEHGPRR